MIFLAKKFVLSIIIRIFAASVPTKPLNDAQMRGAFLYVYVYSQNTLMERLPHFTKHYMTETDLVALLKNRGLIISDETKASDTPFIMYMSAQPLPIGASGMGIDVTKVTLLSWKPLCFAGKV